MSDHRPSAEELFHACRSLPAEERPRYLSRLCGDDRALRERVDRLLAADAAVAEPFLQPPRAGSATKAEVGEQPGDTVDRYKLLQAIGEGGMGTVWMAEQREPVVRKVALKIVKLGMDTREVVVRFEAERQALALMDHPNIAKVLDGGATANGRPYFVMELVKGVPITEYCDRGKLGLRQRLELFTKVCEAIQHAHHKGVIHRDIKPSNVLVTLHDGVPVPKVIDFGIAKATSAELTKKTLFTQYAQILGTPEYMAPEQAEMSGLDIDTRADVYSLGVLLYELLTGTKPFDVKTALQAGFQELLRTIREDEPQKPSTRVSTRGAAAVVGGRPDVNVRAWSERLRGDLDWIVMKALEKDRKRRYDTPNGFAEDIARFLRDEAVLAAPPSAGYRLRKFVHRRRRLVVAAGVAVLLLLAGVVGTSWGMVQALRERDRTEVARAAAQQSLQRAQAAEAKALQSAAETQAVAEFQAQLLGGLDVPAMGIGLRQALLGSVAPGQRDALATSLAAVNFTDLALGALDANVFQRSIRTIETSFADQPGMQARLLQVVGETMRGLGLVAPARVTVLRALELAKQAFGDGDPRTLAVTASLLGVQRDAGEFGAVERGSRQLLTALEQVPDARASDFAHAHVLLGKALSSSGKLDEAMAQLTKARDLFAQADGNDGSEALSVRHSLVVLTVRRGLYAEGERLARELLAQLRRVLGPQHDQTLSTASVLGTILSDTSKLAEAEPILRDVLDAFRARFGDAHPRTLHAKQTLATILERQGRLDEAERLMHEAYAEQVRVLGEGHPETHLSLGSLGAVLLARGDAQGAEPLLAKAVAGLRTALGFDHDETLTVAGHLAGALHRLQRFEESLQLSQAIFEAMQRLHGPKHPHTLNAANNYASALWGLGRAAEAVPVFRAVLPAQREVLGPTHQETLVTQCNLAVNLRQTGALGEAIELLQQAEPHFEDVPDLADMPFELLGMLAERGDAAAVVAQVPKLVARVRAGQAAGSVELAQDLARVSFALLQIERWAEAETLLREVLPIREAKLAGAWQPEVSRSQLGSALLGQRRFAEAEPLLLAGAEGLLQRVESMPAGARFRVREAVSRVVDLYVQWGEADPAAQRAERVAKWRERLGALPSGGR
ncbi:MAG: serine/threonine protein kinase [Planctomycetes bacterium]|nr:serine/threonine protein kinase [Planctomycetota bacterium]